MKILILETLFIFVINAENDEVRRIPVKPRRYKFSYLVYLGVLRISILKIFSFSCDSLL